MKVPCQMLPDTIVFFGLGVEDVKKLRVYRGRRPEDVVLLGFFVEAVSLKKENMKFLFFHCNSRLLRETQAKRRLLDVFYEKPTPF